MAFPDDKIELLKQPITQDMVKTRKAYGSGELSYVPAHLMFDQANEIFGFSEWDTEILTLKEVRVRQYEKKAKNPNDEPKPMIAVMYLATVRLTVRAGDDVATHEDVGYGDGQGADTPAGEGSAIELASKEAITDATKRCLRYFGNKFGNSLYNKENQGVVSQQAIEDDKAPDAEQLEALRGLYEARGITDEWSLSWLKGEDCLFKTIEELNQPWYFALYKAVTSYKLSEILADDYEKKIEEDIQLMRESVTIGMLKALFGQCWRATVQQEDKERQVEIKKIYDDMTAKLDPPNVEDK